MKNLFHITKKVFLEEIFKNGIVINSDKKSLSGQGVIDNYEKRFGMQPIFLTKSPKKIISELSKEYIEKNNLYLLKINIENLNIEDELLYLLEKWDLVYTSFEASLNNCEKYFGNNYICRENIDKKRILNFKKIY